MSLPKGTMSRTKTSMIQSRFCPGSVHKTEATKTQCVTRSTACAPQTSLQTSRRWKAWTWCAAWHGWPHAKVWSKLQRSRHDAVEKMPDHLLKRNMFFLFFYFFQLTLSDCVDVHVPIVSQQHANEFQMTFEMVDGCKHKAFMLHLQGLLLRGDEPSWDKQEVNKNSAAQRRYPHIFKADLQENSGLGGREEMNCNTKSQIPYFGCRSCETKWGWRRNTSQGMNQGAEAAKVIAGSQNFKNPTVLKILCIKADHWEQLMNRIYEKQCLFNS